LQRDISDWRVRGKYICKHNHQAEQTSTLNGSAVNVNRLSKPHWWQEHLRSAPTTKCVLAAALLILLALSMAQIDDFVSDQAA